MSKPILAHFRNGYEHSTLPLGRICVRLGISPDALTITSLVLGGVAAYLAAQSAFVWSVGFILAMGFADMLDGATARAGGTSSDYGTVFDHVVDRYAEFLLLLGIMLSGTVAPAWVVFALFGMVMASYVRARAEATRLVASCSVGFAGRQEKLGLLIVGMLLQPLFPTAELLQWIVISVGVLSHVTAVQRLLYTKRVLRGAEASEQ